MRDYRLPSLPFHRGHTHFWERVLSRRRFVMAAAAVAGGAVASKTLSPLVYAAEAFPVRSTGAVPPKPIPGGTSPFGVFIHHFAVVPRDLRSPLLRGLPS